jgi:Integrase core domain
MSCDLFTVETVFLRTLYVLFFIDVGTRRVRIAVTANPDAGWMTQQARNLAIDGAMDNVRFLIRYRDSKFTASFDEVFRSEGARVMRTPVRAPRANAFAERFVRTVRSELLDLVLVVGRRHLLRLLRDYEAHYNSHRPTEGSISRHRRGTTSALRRSLLTRSNVQRSSVGSSASTTGRRGEWDKVRDPFKYPCGRNSGAIPRPRFSAYRECDRPGE